MWTNSYRSSASPAPRTLPSSSNAKTLVKSPGHRCIVACTKRVSLRKSPRSVHAELSSTNVVSSVLTLPPLPPSGTKPPPSVRKHGLPLSRRPRLKRRRRNRRRQRFAAVVYFLTLRPANGSQPATRAPVSTAPKVSKQQMKGGKGGR